MSESSQPPPRNPHLAPRTSYFVLHHAISSRPVSLGLHDASPPLPLDTPFPPRSVWVCWSVVGVRDCAGSSGIWFRWSRPHSCCSEEMAPANTHPLFLPLAKGVVFVL